MIGILSALGASIAWTISSSLWKQLTNKKHSIQLNTLKNTIATLLFLPIIFQLSWLKEFYSISILFISGSVGIAIGDTLYFSALRRIGTRKTLTMEATAPILASLLGAIFLEETISFRTWIGAIMVAISVVLIAQKNISEFTHISDAKSNINRSGILFAFGSIVCGVIGALISRSVLSQGSLMPLETSAVRILGAFLTLLFISPSINKLVLQDVKKTNFNFTLIILATLLGTNLGILLQQIAFQKLPVGLAVTCLSTSPVMAMFFAKREGDHIVRKDLLACLLSVLGVAVAFA